MVRTAAESDFVAERLASVPMVGVDVQVSGSSVASGGEPQPAGGEDCGDFLELGPIGGPPRACPHPSHQSGGCQDPRQQYAIS